MKFLLTGGAGYLGSVLSEMLLHLKHHVTVLDDLSRCRTSPLHLVGRPGYRLVKGDARDVALLKQLLKDIDVVVPLAGIVGQAACDADPERAATINVDAIHCLLALRGRAGNPRLIFPATNSGYGTKSGVVTCDESTPLEPISHYGQTKVQAERMVLDSADAVSLRFATLFSASPAMRWDLLVNYFVHEAVTRKAIVLFEGGFQRNYLHVRDAARAIMHASAPAFVSGGAYNVGLSHAYTKRELAERVADITGCYLHEAPIGSDPDKRNYVVSAAKFHATGFRTEHEISGGILELKQAALTL